MASKPASPPSAPTAPEQIPLARMRRWRAGRRVAMTALAAFLLAGALGAFGVRTTTATASAQGWTLTVEYAAVTRPGLATPFAFQVTRVEGFDGPVTVAVPGAYLDHFDENGLDPDPLGSTATPDQIEWEFEAPDGDTLAVSYDARWEPASQESADGAVAVLVDGEPVVSVPFRTRVWP